MSKRNSDNYFRFAAAPAFSSRKSRNKFGLEIITPPVDTSKDCEIQISRPWLAEEIQFTEDIVSLVNFTLRINRGHLEANRLLDFLCVYDIQDFRGAPFEDGFDAKGKYFVRSGFSKYEVYLDQDTFGSFEFSFAAWARSYYVYKEDGVVLSAIDWTSVNLYFDSMESRRAILTVAQCIVLRYALGDFEYSSLVRKIMSKDGPDYFIERCCKWMLTQINAMVHDMGYHQGMMRSSDMCSPSGSREATPKDVHELERVELSDPSTSTSGSSSSSSGNSREQSVEPISVQPLQQEQISSKLPLVPSNPASQSTDAQAPVEIINFKPTNQKPNFKFEPSPLAGSLPSFLDALRSANEQLALGISDDQKIELSDSDEGEHIEMDLGLGVLEHVDPKSTSSAPQILGLKRKASADEFDSTFIKAATPPKKLRRDGLSSPVPHVTINLIPTPVKKLNASTPYSFRKAVSVKKPQKGKQASKANSGKIKVDVMLRLTIDHQAGDATIEVDDIVAKAQWAGFQEQLDGDLAELETSVKDMNAVHKSMWKAFEGDELDGNEIVYILDD